jgi:hypothetical protein
MLAKDTEDSPRGEEVGEKTSNCLMNRFSSVHEIARSRARAVNFAEFSRESARSGTDGMDPRPLIYGLAMGPGCAEQHPNKARSDCPGSQVRFRH